MSSKIEEEKKMQENEKKKKLKDKKKEEQELVIDFHRQSAARPHAYNFALPSRAPHIHAGTTRLLTGWNYRFFSLSFFLEVMWGLAHTRPRHPLNNPSTPPHRKQAAALVFLSTGLLQGQIFLSLRIGNKKRLRASILTNSISSAIFV